MPPSLGLREMSVFMVEDLEVECRILCALAAGLVETPNSGGVGSWIKLECLTEVRCLASLVDVDAEAVVGTFLSWVRYSRSAGPEFLGYGADVRAPMCLPLDHRDSRGSQVLRCGRGSPAAPGPGSLSMQRAAASLPVSNVWNRRWDDYVRLRRMLEACSAVRKHVQLIVSQVHVVDA